MDTNASDLVIGTDLFLEHPKVKLMSHQSPYPLYCDFGDGRREVSLELSSQTWMTRLEQEATIKHFKTECYQLDPGALRDAIPQFRLDLANLNVELFSSNKQHFLPLYCDLKKKKNAYGFGRPLLGLCHANPFFSELGLVLTKAAMEKASLVLCTPD